MEQALTTAGLAAQDLLRTFHKVTQEEMPGHVEFHFLGLSEEDLIEHIVELCETFYVGGHDAGMELYRTHGDNT